MNPYIFVAVLILILCIILFIVVGGYLYFANAKKLNVLSESDKTTYSTPRVPPDNYVSPPKNTFNNSDVDYNKTLKPDTYNTQTYNNSNNNANNNTNNNSNNNTNNNANNNNTMEPTYTPPIIDTPIEDDNYNLPNKFRLIGNRGSKYCELGQMGLVSCNGEKNSNSNIWGASKIGINLYTIKNMSTSKYCSNKNGTFVCDTDIVMGDAEKFKINKLDDDNTISIKSNNYCSDDPTQIRCDKPNIGGLEKWKIERCLGNK